MLVLTAAAAEAVKSVTSDPQASQEAGLRISSSVPAPESASALQVEIAQGPERTDQVLQAAGALVFVEQRAAGYLDDKVLDAQVDGTGAPRFSLGRQKPA